MAILAASKSLALAFRQSVLCRGKSFVFANFAKGVRLQSVTASTSWKRRRREVRWHASQQYSPFTTAENERCSLPAKQNVNVTEHRF
jgi:hypothetical protein